MFEKRFKIKIKQTAASIITQEKYLKFVLDEVIKQRNLLESYIVKDSIFLKTLSSYKVKKDAPEIAKKMAEACAIVGVGPMASVAAAIAFYGVKAAIKKGCRFIVFENGGDIAMYINRPVSVGIYSGEKIKDLALRVLPEDNIIGICTSSGKMGHSLSFGNADSVTVISSDPILSDAAATSICNLIKKVDINMIENIIKSYLDSQVKAVIVIIDGYIFMGGKVPELLYKKIPYELITIS
jgi:ApbE superfamily uncharacterized protein (UPF0280 family)